MSRSKSVYVIAIIILLTASHAVAEPYENSRAIAVSGGENHTLVLTADANLWACGDNGWYQLGIGDDTTDQMLLVRVFDGDANSPSGFLENIISIDSGWKHSLAIDINNNVLAWGDNDEGELGNAGDGPYKTAPILVHDGEMGTTLGLLENIVAVSAARSGEYSLALDDANHCWSFGLNNKGQLGNGQSGSSEKEDTPVAVHAGEQNPGNPGGPLSDIVSISAGEEHSAAVDSNGSVFCWGDNLFRLGGSGKLGTGSAVSNSDTPVQVKGEQPGGTYLKNIVAVSVGWDHTLALEEYEEYDLLKALLDPNYTGPDPNHQGKVFSWGCNGQIWEQNCHGGQLGDGTTTNRSTPVIVHAGEQNPTNPNSALKGIIAVSAGENHSLALDVNGFVFAFGCNYYGQLGNGTTDPCTTPVQVIAADTNQPLSGIVAVSAAYWHNLAIDVNGTVWTWGMMDEGRLGLGSAIKAEISTTAHPINLVLNRSKGNYYFGIQTAIDDANNGDVIEATMGTYYEDVDFKTRTITLTSVNPENSDVAEGTVIYGSSDAWIPSVKFYNNSGSALTGFTVTGTDDGIVCTSSSPEITKCVITNNDYRGIYCTNSDTNITDCIINNNGDYGIQSSATEISVHNCIINNNDSNGVYINTSSEKVAITNNIINHNADNGIYSYAYTNSGSVDVAIKNNWIYNNGTDGTGDGIYIEFAYPNPAVIRNNTIADNNDYGIRAGSSTYVGVTNCILWDNGLGQLNNCSATYSCIDIDPISGAHNINSDPCFADDANNFHIKPESKCIDNANSALVTDPNETDIDGECRIMDGDFNGTDIVDMGADELYWPKCDYDRSEIVNFVDFTFFANAWQTTNTTIDLDDDNFVDINDLILFCRDWLWVAPWSARYEQMMMAGGDGEGMVMLAESTVPAVPLPALSYSSTATTEAEPLSTERIKELIDWTERLLETDDELKELVGEAEIQKILDSLKAELEN